MVTRGFLGRQLDAQQAKRIPPGQHLVDGFPVLSTGPAPKIATQNWTFEIRVDAQSVQKWTWEEFNALPQTHVVRDIHCVTSWSKFDTDWEGVLIDDIFAAAGVDDFVKYALATSFDGYTTNLPVADLISGKALVALKYDGQPIVIDHGGPARLLVPHLYFWKSAKWISGIDLFSRNEPKGFWEKNGYHHRGDPWQEQRYSDD